MSKAPAPPRRSRRLLLPFAVLLVVLLIGLIVYIRGTWSDTQTRDPAPGQPPITQLYQSPDGQQQIRSAVILPYSREQVWAVVTDYDNYGKFLPYVSEVKAAPEQNGVIAVSGLAKSALWGYWPFQIDVQENKSGSTWTALWDKPSKPVLRNRGGWTLISKGEQETLLVLTLEAEVEGYPTFFLRNFFLNRLPHVLRAVEQQLQNRTR